MGEGGLPGPEGEGSSEATIFALASGAGRAGVGVIRVSGSACRRVCRMLTGRDAPAGRKAALRAFLDPMSGETIDRGLVIWFPGPSSFTGEDVLELHIHGGSAVLAGIFEALSSDDEVRPAEAGEFSRRAFLNGKLDLTETEGLADLVAAETRQQAKQARRQLDGALGRLYGGWREILLESLAHLEAEIDFAPDEEVPDDLMRRVLPRIEALRAEMAHHLQDGHRGERLRSGLQVALVGPPNAGKSSLINFLSRRDVAIVTDVPGTTRDVLEVPLDLGGYPLTIVDMAGIRRSNDPVESLGIARARERAREADFVLALFDGATWPDIDAETKALIDERALVVVNKIDLLPWPCAISVDGRQAFGISCKTGLGVDHLIERLASLADRHMGAVGAPALTRARHREAVSDAEAALRRIVDQSDGAELALMAEDLRLALGAMGGITGKVRIEEVLDRIFGEFCIGK